MAVTAMKYFTKIWMLHIEREISGYYYDGEKSYILYKDEDGNETMEEWTDELTERKMDNNKKR